MVPYYLPNFRESRYFATNDTQVAIRNKYGIWLMYLCSLAVYMGSGEHTDDLAHWDLLLQESPLSGKGSGMTFAFRSEKIPPVPTQYLIIDIFFTNIYF
jgi:hypothetical protein